MVTMEWHDPTWGWTPDDDDEPNTQTFAEFLAETAAYNEVMGELGIEPVVAPKSVEDGVDHVELAIEATEISKDE